LLNKISKGLGGIEEKQETKLFVGSIPKNASEVKISSLNK